MRCRHDQRAGTNEIPNIAEHLGPIRRVFRNLAAVLQILGIPKEHSAGDLVADGGVDISDAGGCEGSSLAVSASDKSRIWALGVGILKESEHLLDGSGRCSTWESVVSESSKVCTTNALDPDAIRAVFILQLRSDSWAESALDMLEWHPVV